MIDAVYRTSVEQSAAVPGGEAGGRSPKRGSLTADEVNELLGRAPIGRVGVISDGEPYVVPVNFAWLDGRVVVHGSEGGRLVEAVRAGGRVCFEVDEYHGTVEAATPCHHSTEYVSALGFGTAKIVEDPRERTRALKAIVVKYASQEMADRLTDAVAENYRSRRSGSRVRVMQISFDRLSGRFNL